MKRLIACLLAALGLAAFAFAQTPQPTRPPVAGPSATPSPAPSPAAKDEEAGELDGKVKVTVGVYVNDIQTVSLADHSYLIDLYVWLRWDNPTYDPTKSVEFMNAFAAWDAKEDWAFDAPQKQKDGSYYNVIRRQSLFSNKFPLGAYPFDTQALTIAIEDKTYASDQLEFVLDTNPASMNPEIKLPGYDLKPVQIVLRNKPYPTAFGDLDNPTANPYSHIDIRIPVVRPLSSGLFKVLAPMLLVILSAAFALLLDPAHVEARIGLGITALLTLVALQFTLLSGLPEVAYLTLLDQLFLASYGYILTVIGLVVRGTRVDQEGDLQGTVKLKRNWMGAVVLTSLYFIIGAVLYFVNTQAKPDALAGVTASFTAPK
jgi:hypothetical protein